MNTLVKLLADTDYDVQLLVGEEVAKSRKYQQQYQQVLNEFSKLLPDCELVSFPSYLSEPDHDIFINHNRWGSWDPCPVIYKELWGEWDGGMFYLKHVNTHYKCICEMRETWCFGADTESDDY